MWVPADGWRVHSHVLAIMDSLRYLPGIRRQCDRDRYRCYCMASAIGICFLARKSFFFVPVSQTDVNRILGSSASHWRILLSCESR